MTDLATTVVRSFPLLCAAAQPSSSSVQHPTRSSPPQDHTMCLERIGAGSYLAMAAHPDGSGRVFLSTQDGKIWLASVPAHGSGGTLRVDDSATPFLDLTDRVRYDAAKGLDGLMGVAFHSEFATNGRLFVSYTTACDGSGCDPVASGNGPGSSFQYQLVVAEFAVNGSVVDPKAPQADPSEVRRVFTMGLPQPRVASSYSYLQHGGQILFRRPSDGYLYLITGHGEDEAHGQTDFSHDKTSVLGKIIRFNIDRAPGESGRTSSHFNVSTPNMEIFAMGLSNPSGCSFDSERSSHLYCANIDQQQQEQVYLIFGSKAAAEHGASPGTAIVDHGRPADGRMPSIVGGLVYRGSADPTLQGRYVYLYGSAAWTAESPEVSRPSTSERIPSIRCSRSTPLPCGAGGDGIDGRVLSLGEDNSKDAFVLSTGGVYRVVPPGLCAAAAAPPDPAPGSAWVWYFILSAVLFLLCLLWPYLCPAGAGGQTSASCNGCCASIMCCNNGQ